MNTKGYIKISTNYYLMENADSGGKLSEPPLGPIEKRATITKSGEQLLVKIPARMVEIADIKEGQGLVFSYDILSNKMNVRYDTKHKEKRERKEYKKSEPWKKAKKGVNHGKRKKTSATQ